MSMFCFQCQEASKGTGCTIKGICGKPEDVAYAVLYLASNEARFVTGIELVVDGGKIAR